jgi:hypothetical protein
LRGSPIRDPFSWSTCGDEEQFPYGVVEKPTNNKAFRCHQLRKSDAIRPTTQNCLETDVHSATLSPMQLFSADSFGKASTEEAAYYISTNTAILVALASDRGNRIAPLLGYSARDRHQKGPVPR